MFMPFERQQSSRPAPWSPMPDATGTPFTSRGSAGRPRTSTADQQDFREQADGAP